MVWTGGGTRRLAKSLITLIDEVDAKYPDRDRSNDGTIGDTSHQARRSDHNPDSEGVVRALDITHDPAHGVDTYRLAENLRTGRDPRIKYVISNRKIFGDEGYASRNGVSAWTWGAYNGTNPHDMHVHVSVNADDALADDTKPWAIGDVASPHYPRLKPGDGGDPVKYAQSLLGIAVSGAFDAPTETAVRAFQARSGLDVDGIIGPYTWRALLTDHEPSFLGAPASLPTRSTRSRRLPPPRRSPVIAGVSAASRRRATSRAWPSPLPSFARSGGPEIRLRSPWPHRTAATTTLMRCPGTTRSSRPSA
jgi:hypothetical protein